MKDEKDYVAYDWCIHERVGGEGTFVSGLILDLIWQTKNFIRREVNSHGRDYG
jgi:hypothetical protein